MLLHRRGRPSAENRMATRLYQRLELLTVGTSCLLLIHAMLNPSSFIPQPVNEGQLF